MRKSIAHELTKEATSDFERNQLIRYQKRLHYRRIMRRIAAINRSTLIGMSFDSSRHLSFEPAYFPQRWSVG